MRQILLINLLGWLLAAASVAQAVEAQQNASASEPTPALTEQTADPLPWSKLGSDEKLILESYASTWDTLSPAQQHRLARGAERWNSLSPEQREAINQRFETWGQMTPEKRANVRENFQAFRQLPTERQQRLRQAFQRFRGLSPEQRSQLRQHFLQMTPEERRASLDQVRTLEQQQANKATNATATVTSSASETPLSIWQDMTPEERDNLHQRMLPLSVQDRALLRQQLMEMTPAQRSQFLSKDTDQ